MPERFKYLQISLLPSRGSALILALVFTLVVAGASIGIAKIIRNYQHLDVKDVVGTQLVLKSALDYVSNGLKQRWCFDATLIPKATVCNPNDNGNTERLTLPELALRGRLRTTSLATVSPAPRRAIVQKVILRSMTNQHPLKFAVSQLSASESADKALCFSVKRLSSTDPYIQYLPGSNSEALGFLLVRVGLIRSSQSCSEGNSSTPAIQSVLAIYPRELNEFALVVASDLDLSLTGSSTNTGGGDFAIPSFSDRSEAFGANVKGISFVSPVFVNHNLILANPYPTQTSTRPSFPRVDFFAPVYLGEKIQVRQENVVSNFEELKAIPATWNDLPYSGLRRGIRVDGKRDLGLDVLSGQYTPPPPADNEKFQQCLAEQNISANLSLTEGSQLLVKQERPPDVQMINNSTISKFYFRVGVSKLDRFVAISGFQSSATVLETNPCNSVGTACKEISPKEADFTAVPTPGYETAGSILRLEIESGLQSSSTRIMADISTAAKITMPLEIQTRLDGTTQFASSDPAIEIETTPYLVAGQKQPDQFLLTLSVKNAKDNMDRLAVTLHPFTLGNDDQTGSWTRTTPSLEGRIDFIPNASPELISNSFGSNPTTWRSATTGSMDFSIVANAALQLPADDSQRGKIVADCSNGSRWARARGSFLGQTRFAWDFAHPASFSRASGDPMRQTFAGDTDDVFLVRSVTQECTVTSTATKVMGFFICERLVIQPRAQPLEFYGTMIVTNSVQIDRSAVVQGVRFSNIHEPGAIQALRAADVLNNPTRPTGVPWWHPKLSIDTLADMMNGLPGSLRSVAVPFQWTAVDPDCGLIPGGTETTCDHDIKNLVVSELGSKFDL